MELIGSSVAPAVSSCFRGCSLEARPALCRTSGSAVPSGWLHHLAFRGLAAASGQVRQLSVSFGIPVTSSSPHGFTFHRWCQKNNDFLFLATESKVTNSGPLWSQAGGLSSSLAQMHLNDIFSPSWRLKRQRAGSCVVISSLPMSLVPQHSGSSRQLGEDTLLPKPR